MSKTRWITINLTLLLLLGATAFCALNIGSTTTSLFDPISPTRDAILWTARFPRILLAIIVGMALGSAGTAYQALLRNPLADPYILGVAGGAALGSALGIGLGLPFPLIALLAFGASLATITGIVAISRGAGTHFTFRLLLTGVVCNAFAFALMMVMHVFVPAERSQEILALLMGNLTLADPQILLWLTIIVFAGLALLLRRARALDAWALGEETAASLGIATDKLQREVFIAGSLIVGAAVAASGLIGFVGLFIPHAVRMVVGHGHRLVLPASALVGGAFLVIADTVARSVLSYGTYQTELPVGVITALVGAPCFLWLLKRSQR